MEPILEWDVVVLGGLNTDYLIRGPQLPGPGMSLDGDVFLETPGGKGANAGDAFAAGLAVALVDRLPLPDAARFASGAAALKTTALGAQMALPTRHELKAYLERTAYSRRGG